MRPFGDFFFKAKSSFLFEESLDIVGDIAKTHLYEIVEVNVTYVDENAQQSHYNVGI